MFSGICKQCSTRHRENCLSSPLRVDFEEDLGKENNVLIHVYNKTMVRFCHLLHPEVILKFLNFHIFMELN
jgi:hypothetical protein